MILQTLNIVSGVVLGAPKLKEWIGEKHITSIERALTKHRDLIGLTTLVFGILGLLIRTGILDLYFYPLGASYPQALTAIVMGMLLYSHKLEQFPILRRTIATLKPHETLIGIIGILVGLGSLLFGCPLCYSF